MTLILDHGIDAPYLDELANTVPRDVATGAPLLPHTHAHLGDAEADAVAACLAQIAPAATSVTSDAFVAALREYLSGWSYIAHVRAPDVADEVDVRAVTRQVWAAFVDAAHRHQPPTLVD